MNDRHEEQTLLDATVMPNGDDHLRNGEPDHHGLLDRDARTRDITR